MFTNNHSDDEQGHWVSFTDLVLGFMAIFIVVSLVSLTQIRPEEQPKATDSIPEKVDTIVIVEIQDNDNEKGVYQLLIDVFRERLAAHEAIEIADSATIRFTVNENSRSPLFRPDQSRLTTYFRGIMEEVLPIFLEELYTIYSKPDEDLVIREIRIEGHTDPAGEYFHNLSLSTNRALAVQKYILQSEALAGYPVEFRSFMEKNTIACGYSFSRTLDSQGELVDRGSRTVDFDKSRRVEFRILLEKK